MGHAVVRREGDIVARLDDLAFGKTETVALYDLLGQGLGSCWCGGRSAKELRRRILELRVKSTDGLSLEQGASC